MPIVIVKAHSCNDGRKHTKLLRSCSSEELLEEEARQFAKKASREEAQHNQTPGNVSRGFINSAKEMEDMYALRVIHISHQSAEKGKDSEVITTVIGEDVFFDRDETMMSNLRTFVVEGKNGNANVRQGHNQDQGGDGSLSVGVEAASSLVAVSPVPSLLQRIRHHQATAEPCQRKDVKPSPTTFKNICLLNIMSFISLMFMWSDVMWWGSVDEHWVSVLHLRLWLVCWWKLCVVLCCVLWHYFMLYVYIVVCMNVYV